MVLTILLLFTVYFIFHLLPSLTDNSDRVILMRFLCVCVCVRGFQLLVSKLWKTHGLHCADSSISSKWKVLLERTFPNENNIRNGLFDGIWLISHFSWCRQQHETSIISFQCMWKELIMYSVSIHYIKSNNNKNPWNGNHLFGSCMYLWSKKKLSNYLAVVS